MVDVFSVCLQCRKKGVSKLWTGRLHLTYSTGIIQLKYSNHQHNHNHWPVFVSPQDKVLGSWWGQRSRVWPIFHQVSHLCQCCCLYVQLVHRLCQSFKCGSWKSRLWAQPSGASASASAAAKLQQRKLFSFPGSHSQRSCTRRLAGRLFLSFQGLMLSSSMVLSMPEAMRQSIWSKLIDFCVFVFHLLWNAAGGKMWSLLKS